MDFQPFFDTYKIDNFDGRQNLDLIEEENDYDAINDETFGGELSNFDNDGDLEEFANRTAKLNLDEPSYSAANPCQYSQNSASRFNDKPQKDLRILSNILHNSSLQQNNISCHNLLQSHLKPLNVKELEEKMLNEATKMALKNKVSNREYISLAPDDSFSTHFLAISNSQDCFGPNVILPENRAHGPSKPYVLTKKYVSNSTDLLKLSNLSTHNYEHCPPARNEGQRLPFTTIHRHNRPKGLPSSKTISDFAFDPYAGFMSKKEREWLIKIHLIQCMGTGDPVDDDFYYTIWKKRNVLKKTPDSWMIKIQPEYYSFEDTYPSPAYVPPSFSGTLGKPSHCSAKIPRQIIDLAVEFVDDDEIDNSGNKNNQRKLKAILMRIENTALVFIECNDLKRKLLSIEDNNSATELKFKLKEKIESIISSLCAVEILPTVMLIQKGRSLLFQIMPFCAQDDMFSILKVLIETLPKYAKKIPEDSVTDYTKKIFAFFSSLSKLQLIGLINFFRFDKHIVNSLKVLLAVLISMLILLAKLKICAHEISKSSTFEWLCMCAPTNGTQVFNAFSNEGFVPEDLVFLKHWLLSEAVKEGNTAELLANGIEKFIISEDNICACDFQE